MIHIAINKTHFSSTILTLPSITFVDLLTNEPRSESNSLSISHNVMSVPAGAQSWRRRPPPIGGVVSAVRPSLSAFRTLLLTLLAPAGLCITQAFVLWDRRVS